MFALRWLLGFGSADFRTGAYARVRAHCEGAGLSPWVTMCQLEAGTIRVPIQTTSSSDFGQSAPNLTNYAAMATLSPLVTRWLPERSR